MLVLTRKQGESINVGENIFVKILSVENGQVRVGIDAPGGIRIYRTELYEQTQGQNELAARADRTAVMNAVKLVHQVFETEEKHKE